MFWFSQKNNSLIFSMKNPTSWICILHLQQLIFFKTMKIWKGRQHIKIKCSTPLKKRCCKKKNYKYIKKKYASDSNSIYDDGINNWSCNHWSYGSLLIYRYMFELLNVYMSEWTFFENINLNVFPNLVFLA